VKVWVPKPDPVLNLLYGSTVSMPNVEITGIPE